MDAAEQDGYQGVRRRPIGDARPVGQSWSRCRICGWMWRSLWDRKPLPQTHPSMRTSRIQRLRSDGFGSHCPWWIVPAPSPVWRCSVRCLAELIYWVWALDGTGNRPVPCEERSDVARAMVVVGGRVPCGGLVLVGGYAILEVGERGRARVACGCAGGAIIVGAILHKLNNGSSTISHPQKSRAVERKWDIRNAKSAFKSRQLR